MHEVNRTFASGTPANNHIDGGHEEVPGDIAATVVEELVRFSAPMFKHVRFVAPVPNGANGWAEAVKEERRDSGLIVMKAAKVDRRKFVETEETEKALDRLFEQSDRPKGIVLDDVTMDGGTGEAMADFYSERGLEITLVMSLLYRGRDDRIQSAYKRTALMRRFLPYLINWSLYKATGRVQELEGENT